MSNTIKYYKEQLVGELIRIDPNNAAILEEFGMGCMGCPASQAESLEDACMVHGLEVDQVLTRLNKGDK